VLGSTKMWDIKFLVQSVIWRDPYLFVINGFFRNKRGVFKTDFDLALEGYPRSGNTYTRRMLESSQRPGLRIRSHMHVPPFVLAAIRKGKPTALLVRNPVDTIVSWHLFTGAPIEFISKQYMKCSPKIGPVA